MDWTRISTIGQGSTATVSLATAAHSGEIFAAKSAELSLSKPLQTEQSILSKLDSPYIVKYKGFDTTEENNKLIFNLFTEYLPRGTLFEEIQRLGGKLQEAEIMSYTWDILQGLEYLHANGIVHCDIKSTNILMGKESAKISDLGCAKHVEKGDSGKLVFSGTPMFMSPEVVLGKDQGFESDIWSLGCTVIEMATGKSPWPQVNDPISALYRIGFSDESPELPRWLSQKSKDFLSMCLKRDPKERLTAKELLKHPFFDDLGLKKGQKVMMIKEDSPRSVFDQSVFWDCQLGHEEEASSCLVSAAERIKRLLVIGSDCNNNNNVTSVSSTVSDWDLDQDWITVRGSEISDVIYTNEVSCLGVQIQLDQEISTIRKRGLDVAFGIVENDNVFIRNLKFKKGNDNFCSLQYIFIFNSHIPYSIFFVHIFLNLSCLKYLYFFFPVCWCELSMILFLFIIFLFFGCIIIIRYRRP